MMPVFEPFTINFNVCSYGTLSYVTWTVKYITYIPETLTIKLNNDKIVHIHINTEHLSDFFMLNNVNDFPDKKNLTDQLLFQSPINTSIIVNVNYLYIQ